MSDKVNRALSIFAGIAVSTYIFCAIATHFMPTVKKSVSDMTIGIASTFYSNKVKWKSNYVPNQERIIGPDIDVKVRTKVKGREYEGVGKLNSHTKVLLPFIALISLILATPIGLKNKLISLGLGMFVFFIYLMFLFKWTIGYVAKVTAGADISSLWFGQVFNTNIGFMTILPTIIWVMVTLWAVDWNQYKTGIEVGNEL